MGYYITLEESDAMIRKEDLDKAYKAMCELNKHDDLKTGGSYSNGQQTARWFAWMPENYPEVYSTAQEVLEGLGFELDVDQDTGNVYIARYDSKTGAQDLFLGAIAPYIKNESNGMARMIWRGEDGSYWRLSFEDDKMFIEDGKIEFIRRTEYAG